MGQDKLEEITDKEQVWGMDMKFGTGEYKYGLIEDAAKHGYGYQNDAKIGIYIFLNLYSVLYIFLFFSFFSPDTPEDTFVPKKEKN